MCPSLQLCCRSRSFAHFWLVPSLSILCRSSCFKHSIARAMRKSPSKPFYICICLLFTGSIWKEIHLFTWKEDNLFDNSFKRESHCVSWILSVHEAVVAEVLILQSLVMLNFLIFLYLSLSCEWAVNKSKQICIHVHISLSFAASAQRCSEDLDRLYAGLFFFLCQTTNLARLVSPLREEPGFRPFKYFFLIQHGLGHRSCHFPAKSCLPRKERHFFPFFFLL